MSRGILQLKPIPKTKASLLKEVKVQAQTGTLGNSQSAQNLDGDKLTFATDETEEEVKQVIGEESAWSDMLHGYEYDSLLSRLTIQKRDDPDSVPHIDPDLLQILASDTPHAAVAFAIIEEARESALEKAVLAGYVVGPNIFSEIEEILAETLRQYRTEECVEKSPLVIIQIIGEYLAKSAKSLRGHCFDLFGYVRLATYEELLRKLEGPNLHNHIIAQLTCGQSSTRVPVIFDLMRIVKDPQLSKNSPRVFKIIGNTLSNALFCSPPRTLELRNMFETENKHVSEQLLNCLVRLHQDDMLQRSVQSLVISVLSDALQKPCLQKPSIIICSLAPLLRFKAFKDEIRSLVRSHVRHTKKSRKVQYAAYFMNFVVISFFSHKFGIHICDRIHDLYKVTKDANLNSILLAHNFSKKKFIHALLKVSGEPANCKTYLMDLFSAVLPVLQDPERHQFVERACDKWNKILEMDFRLLA